MIKTLLTRSVLCRAHSMHRSSTILTNKLNMSLLSRSLSVVPFKLADIGEGIAEVELLKWFVKEGDTVQAFDRLCEVQSDKATVEITSRYDGMIAKVYHGEGDIVKVGSTLVDISSSEAIPISSIEKEVFDHGLDKSTQRSMPTGTVAGNITPFKLADIGEGIAEVELLKWFVKEGDTVRAFDRLCEVQSDKATVEITSRYDGKIAKVYHGEGDIVKVGNTLVDIANSDVQDSSSTNKMVTEEAGDNKLHVPHQAESVPAMPLAQIGVADRTALNTSPHHTGSARGGRGAVLTTPAVRKLARENSINLSMVAGTGPKGRILKEDILRYIKDGKLISQGSHSVQYTHTPTTYEPLTSSAPASSPASLHSPSISSNVRHNIGDNVAPTTEGGNTPPSSSSGHLSKDQILALRQQQQQARRVPIRGVARLMLKSMSDAREVQHLVFNEEVTFDEMKTVREQLNSVLAQGNHSVKKMSFLPIMIKATALALLKYPILNAALDADSGELLFHDTYNIGIAMDTPKGLIVPVIKHVEIKNVFEIAEELAALQVAGASGKLTEAQLSGATFSISNIGSVGGTYASPVVVPPQLGIGAFGRMQMVPRYVHPNNHKKAASFEMIENGEAVVAPMTVMNVSWSADHRVIDGATIARFSNYWKHFIEHPSSMIAVMN